MGMRRLDGAHGGKTPKSAIDRCGHPGDTPGPDMAGPVERRDRYGRCREEFSQNKFA